MLSNNWKEERPWTCDVNTRGLFRVWRYLKHLSSWATNTVTIRWPWLRAHTVGQMLYKYTVKTSVVTVRAHVSLRVCVCVHSLFMSRTVLKLELNLIFQLLLSTACDAMCAKLKCTYTLFLPPSYTPTNKHTNLPSPSPWGFIVNKFHLCTSKCVFFFHDTTHSTATTTEGNRSEISRRVFYI